MGVLSSESEFHHQVGANVITPPPIYVCMLNWDGREHLEYALPSVLATDYPNYELVLIDNASTDDSTRYVKERFPTIRMILNRDNLGWAGGNNVGIRDAQERGFDWIVLLNNDVLVDPRWLRDAMNAATSDPMIGLIGFDVLGGGCKIPREEFYAAQEAYSGLEVAECEEIPGCALMIRVDVIANIGLIDEHYFLYGEEDDLECRAVSAGYRMVRTNVPVWHYSEGSSGRIPLRSAYFAMRNSLRLGIKTRSYGLFEILKWTAVRLGFACCPFVKANPENAMQRRMRPTKNPVVNGWLVLRALLWNLVHFRESRMIWQRDREEIEATRRKFEKRRR